jgi:hypothetical protein
VSCREHDTHLARVSSDAANTVGQVVSRQTSVKQDGETLSVQRPGNKAFRREAIKGGVEGITQGRDHKFVSKDSHGNESRTKDREH